MNKPTMSDLAEVLFAAAVAQGRADALKASAIKMQRDLEAAERAEKMSHADKLLMSDIETATANAGAWK